MCSQMRQFLLVFIFLAGPAFAADMRAGSGKEEMSVPASVLAAVEGGATYDQAFLVLVREVPDERERAVMSLALLGARSGDWEKRTRLEDFAVRHLNAASPVAAAAALALAGKTQTTLLGAARWVLGEATPAHVDLQVISPVLRKIVRVGLTQSVMGNRLKTVAFLERVGTTETRGLLRECLEGKYVAPGGNVKSIAATERAHAAVVLARDGDLSILPVLEKLVATASVEDEPLYRKALELLDQASTARTVTSL